MLCTFFIVRLINFIFKVKAVHVMCVTSMPIDAVELTFRNVKVVNCAFTLNVLNANFAFKVADMICFLSNK